MFPRHFFFPVSTRRKESLRERVRTAFFFGYDNYKKYAYPLDELDPINCKGRGPDVENLGNININDVLGGYMLTLVDTLDTLAIMGNYTEFENAVEIVTENLHFELDTGWFYGIGFMESRVLSKKTFFLDKKGCFRS